MRILYSTDKHIRKTNPRSRKDNYFESTLLECEHISRIGNEAGVDLFLDGGDLFDKEVQSALEINRTADFLAKRKAPTWGVIGNHPIRGNYDEWKMWSGIRSLENMDLLKVLSDFDSLIELDGVKFRLHHTDLVENPVPWPHTLWEDYDPKGADVVLISHYHPCQGYKKVNGVWFISPGAISRGTLIEDNLKRAPAATLITIEKGKIEFKHIEIPHEKDVFNERAVVKAEKLEIDKAAMRRSISTLKAGVDRGTITARDMIRTVAESTNASPDALTLAIELLERRT